MLDKFRQIGTELIDLLKLQTYPVAVKIVRTDEDFPENIRRPSKILGHKITLCQGFTMTRRYGWTLGISKEECLCNVAKILYGWRKLRDKEDYVKFLLKAGFFLNEEAAEKGANFDLKKCTLRYGFCNGIITSPLNRAKIDPDIVLIYGNPTQTFILIHGYLSSVGGALDIEYTGRHASCGHGVIQTYLSEKPNVVFPDEGDCIFAATEKDEVIFATPAKILDTILNGIKHIYERKIIRYPTPYYLRFEPVFPEAFRELGEKLV